MQEVHKNISSKCTAQYLDILCFAGRNLIFKQVRQNFEVFFRILTFQNITSYYFLHPSVRCVPFNLNKSMYLYGTIHFPSIFNFFPVTYFLLASLCVKYGFLPTERIFPVVDVVPFQSLPRHGVSHVTFERHPVNFLHKHVSIVTCITSIYIYRRAIVESSIIKTYQSIDLSVTGYLSDFFCYRSRSGASWNRWKSSIHT